MTMGTDEPRTAAPAGQVEQPYLDALDSERARSVAVYQAGFDGWLAFADVVADTNPDRAAVMVAGAYVARAALEEQIPSLLEGLGEATGLSPNAIDELAQTLRADNLDFTCQASAEMLLGDSTDTVQAFQQAPGQPATFDIDDVIHDFLRSPLIVGSAAMYEETARLLSEHEPKTDFAHWTVTCSLDLPSVLGGGQQPIYCARRGHKTLGTQLRAQEFTYFPQVRSGYNGVVKGSGPVEGGQPGYRDSINDQQPTDYWALIETFGGGWAYALYLIEGTNSKVAATLAGLWPGQRQRIHDEIARQVDRAQVKFKTVLQGLKIAGNLVDPLTNLIATAATKLLTVIVDQALKPFADTPLTPWTIWHTALMGSDQVPISIFTLENRGVTTPPLCQLVYDPAAGHYKPDHNYGYNAPLEGSTRFMIGQTAIPQAGIDPRYFGLVAISGQPLAWCEPLQTNSAFRTLLPHLDRTLDPYGRDPLDENRYRTLAAKSKKVYVSAIRADVHLDFRAAAGGATAWRREGANYELESSRHTRCWGRRALPRGEHRISDLEIGGRRRSSSSATTTGGGEQKIYVVAAQRKREYAEVYW